MELPGKTSLGGSPDLSPYLHCRCRSIDWPDRDLTVLPRPNLFRQWCSSTPSSCLSGAASPSWPLPRRVDPLRDPSPWKASDQHVSSMGHRCYRFAISRPERTASAPFLVTYGDKKTKGPASSVSIFTLILAVDPHRLCRSLGAPSCQAASSQTSRSSLDHHANELDNDISCLETRPP